MRGLRRLVIPVILVVALSASALAETFSPGRALNLRGIDAFCIGVDNQESNASLVVAGVAVAVEEEIRRRAALFDLPLITSCSAEPMVHFSVLRQRGGYVMLVSVVAREPTGGFYDVTLYQDMQLTTYNEQVMTPLALRETIVESAVTLFEDLVLEWRRVRS